MLIIVSISQDDDQQVHAQGGHTKLMNTQMCVRAAHTHTHSDIIHCVGCCIKIK